MGGVGGAIIEELGGIFDVVVMVVVDGEGGGDPLHRRGLIFQFLLRELLSRLRAQTHSNMRAVPAEDELPCFSPHKATRH